VEYLGRTVPPHFSDRFFVWVHSLKLQLGGESMALDYTWNKLYTAVLTLATGTADIQERLNDAYANALIRLTPNDFPDDLRQLYNVDDLWERLSQQEYTDEEASAIANQVVELFEKVVRLDP
jgi:hypothetical protein